MNEILLQKINSNLAGDCKYLRHESAMDGVNPDKRNNGRIRVYFEDSVGTERSFIMSDHPTRNKKDSVDHQSIYGGYILITEALKRGEITEDQAKEMRIQHIVDRFKD